MMADRVVPRKCVALAVRAMVDEERLRLGVAAVLGLALHEVRALGDDADPAVRCELRRWPRGFALQLDLFVDTGRVPLPPREVLAARLAGTVGSDVAHHDGSGNPYGYVLARPDGRRFSVEEMDDKEAWLILDERDGRMKELPTLS
jgi:hypothetical protein